MSPSIRPEDFWIMVVDDEPDITDLFDDYLGELGFNVVTATTAEMAQRVFFAKEIDLVLLDINMPKVSGLRLLDVFKNHRAEVIVIMVTAIRDIDMVVKCIQMGAYDYLAKPIVDLSQLKVRIDRALSERQTKKENVALRQELALHKGIPEIRSNSVAMKKALDMIQTVSQYDTTVLLSGESGTGKEVAARRIHAISHRSPNPFITLNCGSIPETLLESTLFGYEKGAFTGATSRRIGLFEESHRGTIFLDEITETSQEFQIQLLRVLEDNRIRRVGGTGEIKLDLRVIAATNQDIERLVKEGRFREDLYYRLNVFHIILPPLRDRKEDIPAIADYHLSKLAQKMGKENVRLSPAVLRSFNEHEWKGNIREMANVIENALIMCQGDVIRLSDLPPQMHAEQELEASSLRANQEYQRAKEDFERLYLSNLLRQVNGNVSKAARISGLSRQHFHLKLKKLGLRK